MDKRTIKKSICLVTVWVFLLSQFAYAGLYEDILGVPSTDEMPTWDGSSGWRNPKEVIELYPKETPTPKQVGYGMPTPKPTPTPTPTLPANVNFTGTITTADGKPPEGATATLPTQIPPSSTLTATDINLPDSALAPVAPQGATATLIDTPEGAEFQYDTSTAGWAGGGFTYDDFGTPEIETTDLSSLTNIIIGLKGTPTEVKFEIVDNQGNKASVKLTDISSSTEKVWSIPTALLAEQGIDLQNVRLIYLIVEGTNKSGTLLIRATKTIDSPLIGILAKDNGHKEKY